MTIVSCWNVNSINSRLERCARHLLSFAPDYLCLQETKCQDEKFPFAQLADLGYRITHRGQKAYNGVAILAKEGNPDGIVVSDVLWDEDPAARFLHMAFDSLNIINVYVPNGNKPGSEKFAYKMAWYQQLKDYLKNWLPQNKPTILCGDFNVALSDMEVHDPVKCVNRILCTDDERRHVQDIIELGFWDSFRALHPEAKEFSWWDYRELSFQINKGYRIDYLFCANLGQDDLRRAWIDRNERKGEKPSDHVPVMLELH